MFLNCLFRCGKKSFPSIHAENAEQDYYGDYTVDKTVDQVCSHYAAGSCQQWLHRHCPVTV